MEPSFSGPTPYFIPFERVIGVNTLLSGESRIKVPARVDIICGAGCCPAGGTVGTLGDFDATDRLC